MESFLICDLNNEKKTLNNVFIFILEAVKCLCDVFLITLWAIFAVSIFFPVAIFDSC